MIFKFSIVSFYALFALFALAAATPAPVEKRWGTPTTTTTHPVTTTITVTAPGATGTVAAGNCNTGPVQCCNSTGKANDSVISTILGLLGLDADPDVLVGVQCSPLSGVGLGSGNAW